MYSRHSVLYTFEPVKYCAKLLLAKLIWIVDNRVKLVEFEVI